MILSQFRGCPQRRSGPLQPDQQDPSRIRQKDRHQGHQLPAHGKHSEVTVNKHFNGAKRWW